jgi:hypothetical protein
MTTASSCALTPFKLSNYAIAQLAVAQSNFLANPSSYFWEETIHAMFVHQQVQHIVNRGGLLGAYELCETLVGLPLDNWDDAISVHSTGSNVREALQEYAVF